MNRSLEVFFVIFLLTISTPACQRRSEFVRDTKGRGEQQPGPSASAPEQERGPRQGRDHEPEVPVGTGEKVEIQREPGGTEVSTKKDAPPAIVPDPKAPVLSDKDQKIAAESERKSAGSEVDRRSATSETDRKSQANESIRKSATTEEKRIKKLDTGKPPGETPGKPGNPGDTPLVLDCNKDNVLATAFSEQNKTVAFDINHDSKKDLVEWVSSSECLLVIDLNRNGKIDSGAELFGNTSPLIDGSGKAPEGFAALKQYDLNRDNQINSQDQVYSELLLWRDQNANGISESNELVKLTSSDVASISLMTKAPASHDEIKGGKRVVSGLIGSYRTRSGKTYKVIDFIFIKDSDSKFAIQK